MEELKTIETVDTSPFKHLVMTLGELPTSFVDSMTYYECLAWLVNYIQNTVIPAVNNNGEAVTELQENFVELNDAFTTLKNYVDNYFDNLDVQEEVNTKLDAMAEDGTLASLISTQILGDLSTLHTTNKTTIVAAVNETYDREDTIKAGLELQIGDVKMNDYRKDYYSHWDKVTIPSAITDTFFNNFHIYTNTGKNYIVDFNRNNFKNVSTNTFYVATTGNNTTGDGTENNPYKTIYEAYKHCTAGDTIIVKNGIYPRQGTPSSNSTEITKSINIIGESIDGVWFKEADDHTWVADSTYTNVYTTERTGVTEVIDIRRKSEGIFTYLTQATSLESCAATPNSYYFATPNVYVNLDGEVVSDNNIVVGLSLGSQGLFRCQDFIDDSLVYMENINILNSDNCGFHCNNNTEHTVTFYLKNCKIYNNRAGSYQLDNVTSRGCFSICENVVCNNGRKDGFNYHSVNSKPSIGIEINCTSINCGYGQSGSGFLSNNATTAHNDCQVIRVNGVYGYCNGGVAVDIDSVVSAFYGCTIFDSYGRSYDLFAGGNAVMYVIDCYFKGSKANENLRAGETSYVYYNAGTEFDTKSGDNVILIS